MSNSLLNSMVRGFGSQVGRRAANSVINNAGKSTGKHSGFTIVTGTVIIGGILGLLIAAILNAMIGSFGIVLGFGLGMYLMYRYYTSANTKYEERYEKMVENREQALIIIKDVEQKYVNNEITKREYEILYRDANKLLRQIEEDILRVS
jgi:hypothetical protein